jgi:5-(carboxyamino)imidazole ribonucleotide synthase
MAVIEPGATIGIFGGGQLGRMTAMAARSCGYQIQVLDPSGTRCAAAPVADGVIGAPFDDVAAAKVLGRRSQVVTIEIEKISLGSMEAASELAPVRPGRHVLAAIQDRGRQKDSLVLHGLPVAEYRTTSSPEELAEAARALGENVFVKASRGGYDGRGQFHLTSAEQAEHAWDFIGAEECVAERALELELELSVMVARRPGGQMLAFPPALNHHENRILDWSVIPGPLPEKVAAEAERLALDIAKNLDVIGLIAVELFLLKDGRLLVNELAPRPHNSYHASERACVTSQFEQLVRAICDLPLGSVDVVRPTAIVNLLGDLWLGERPPAWEEALKIPGVRLHLYGKGDARPGRKMGHISAQGSTPEEAVKAAQAAENALLLSAGLSPDVAFMPSR